MGPSRSIVDVLVQHYVEQRTFDLFLENLRALFDSSDVLKEENANLYTSVHYVVGSNSRTEITGEIQVRTLAEELWGEVDHKINYPQKSESLACREQVKVLARVTSSSTRLVDSIFASSDDHAAQVAVWSQKVRGKTKRPGPYRRGR